MVFGRVPATLTRTAAVAGVACAHAEGSTGLVSNCAGATAPLWPGTPLAGRLDAVALSSELGLAKPDPTIFLAACARLGVEPAECVYVGDGADDELGAAAALGMDVVRSTQFKPASGSWPPARIAALSELPALLGTPLRSAAVPAVPAPADFEKVVDVSGLSEAPRFS